MPPQNPSHSLAVVSCGVWKVAEGVPAVFVLLTYLIRSVNMFWRIEDRQQQTNNNLLLSILLGKRRKVSKTFVYWCPSGLHECCKSARGNWKQSRVEYMDTKIFYKNWSPDILSRQQFIDRMYEWCKYQSIIKGICQTIISPLWYLNTSISTL